MDDNPLIFDTSDYADYIVRGVIDSTCDTNNDEITSCTQDDIKPISDLECCINWFEITPEYLSTFINFEYGTNFTTDPFVNKNLSPESYKTNCTYIQEFNDFCSENITQEELHKLHRKIRHFDEWEWIPQGTQLGPIKGYPNLYRRIYYGCKYNNDNNNLKPHCYAKRYTDVFNNGVLKLMYKGIHNHPQPSKEN